jgi:uncharacterized integral membrane protein
MKWIKTFLWMVAFFFAIHFSMQNKEEVSIRYFIQNYRWFELTKVPLFLVILCSVFLGVLIGGLGDLYGRFKLKRALRQNHKMIERMERELQSLRGPELEKPSYPKKEG